MQRRFAFFCLFLAIFCLKMDELAAQTQGKKINFSAKRLEYDEKYLPGVDRFIGNVVFSHGEMVGYCDSVHFFKNHNYLEGYGERIRIRINDSVTLYGQFLTYNGDTKITTISRNVVLQDNNSALYTDSLIYNTNLNLGYYLTGGRMVSDDNVLTSVVGNYFTNANRIILRHDVQLTNNSYTMNCDSLAYNTNSETVFFISRTHLVSDENTIYTNSGWYNTNTDVSLLVDSVELYNKTQRLTGDSLYYDRKTRSGTGWQNITLIDSVKEYILQGNYAEYFELGGFSVLTDSAVATLIDQGDSLFLHADTLKMNFDSLQEPQLMLAHNHVKFFRKDIQGVCDSLSFIVPDSLMTMYYNPVIWSGENQLSADTISFYIIDSANITVHLNKAGFIVSALYDEAEFNQIKGTTITGYIRDQQLTRVDVISNAECLYYIQEEDSSLIGINSSATSEMQITLHNNEVAAITFYNAPDGTIFPDKEVERKDRLLKDFRWLPEYRATKPEDIFSRPIPRK